MAPLLTSLDYPAVRAAIDVSLDTTGLPDATIELPIYAGAADLDIKRRDPSWASRTGDERARLKNAAVYLTAALLAPAVPSLSAEQYGDYRYQRQAVDWPARAAELRALAEAELSAYLEATTTTPDRPTLFARACGRRGR